MKKIIAIFSALLLLTLTLSACGQDAVEISPYGHLPETYEIVYAIHNEDGTVSQCTGGCDANGNLYYCDVSGNERVFHLVDRVELSSNSYSLLYDKYESNDETGEYELYEENSSAVSRRMFDDCYKSAHAAIYGGSYKKVDASALTVTDELNYDLLDVERFEYYEITTSGGKNLVAAVEKNTGICFYACYESGYSFVIVKYNDAYTGNYADLLPKDNNQ